MVVKNKIKNSCIGYDQSFCREDFKHYAQTLADRSPRYATCGNGGNIRLGNRQLRRCFPLGRRFVRNPVGERRAKLLSPHTVRHMGSSGSKKSGDKEKKLGIRGHHQFCSARQLRMLSRCHGSAAGAVLSVSSRTQGWEMQARFSRSINARRFRDGRPVRTVA